MGTGAVVGRRTTPRPRPLPSSPHRAPAAPGDGGTRAPTLPLADRQWSPAYACGLGTGHTSAAAGGRAAAAAAGRAWRGGGGARARGAAGAGGAAPARSSGAARRIMCSAAPLACGAWFHLQRGSARPSPNAAAAGRAGGEGRRAREWPEGRGVLGLRPWGEKNPSTSRLPPGMGTVPPVIGAALKW